MKTYKELIEKNTKSASVGIFTGRFQPVSTAHNTILKMISKKHKRGIVFLVKGKASSQTSKNPFDENLQLKMLNAIAPKNIEIKIIPTAFFGNQIDSAKELDFVLYCGTDRIEKYKKMMAYIKNKNIIVKEITRTGDDVSATKIRKAITDNDISTFKAMTPKAIHSFFSELQSVMNRK